MAQRVKGERRKRLKEKMSQIKSNKVSQIKNQSEKIHSKARSLNHTQRVARQKIQAKAKSLNNTQRVARRRIRAKAKEIALRRDVQKKLMWLVIFFGIGFVLWLFFSILYSQTGFHLINWIRSLTFFDPFFSWVQEKISSQTPLGFYLLFSIAALFFFPTPLELIYFGFLQQGVNFQMIFVMTLLGVITAQHINYVLGRFLGNFLHRFIRKKSRDRLKYILHEKGGYAIFIIHMLPLPYALLNFVVGVTKYPYRKWVMLMIPALMINYFVFFLLYLVVF
jgi:membrane protein DedA with SNARE-associated domain